MGAGAVGCYHCDIAAVQTVLVTCVAGLSVGYISEEIRLPLLTSPKSECSPQTPLQPAIDQTFNPAADFQMQLVNTPVISLVFYFTKNDSILTWKQYV